jgi:hypothetical protein
VYRASFSPEFEPFELDERSRRQPLQAERSEPAQPRLFETGEVWAPAGKATLPQDVAAFRQQVKGGVNLLYVVIGILAVVAAVIVVGIIILGARSTPPNPSLVVPLE